MDDDVFFRRYSSFLARSDEEIHVVEWFHAHAKELRFHDVRSVLSIGAGSGSLDLQLLSCFSSLEKYAVLDPNQVMIVAFKKAIQQHKLSGGLLKDRNLDNLFVFECSKFEEVSVERFAEMLSQPRGNAHSPATFDDEREARTTNAEIQSVDMEQKQALLPLFDLAIMAHCMYYMDPKSAVLRAGLIARKLIILQNTEDVRLRIRLNAKFTTDETERLIVSSNTLRALKELAARPEPQSAQANGEHSTATIPSNSESSAIGRIRVNFIGTWRLPFSVDVKDIDDDTLGFLFRKSTEPEEREQLRQCLQRELPDGYHLGTSDVFVLTFDGERKLT